MFRRSCRCSTLPRYPSDTLPTEIFSNLRVGSSSANRHTFRMFKKKAPTAELSSLAAQLGSLLSQLRDLTVVMIDDDDSESTTNLLEVERYLCSAERQLERLLRRLQ